jgi:hypothetical protein
MKLIAPRLLAGVLLATAAAQPGFAEQNEHPAVQVARSWASQPIDANTFIVAHPARLTLLSESSTGRAGISQHANEHPAIEVARTWSNHPIDANTFIVAHPARLTLLAVSPTTSEAAILATSIKARQ